MKKEEVPLKEAWFFSSAVSRGGVFAPLYKVGCRFFARKAFDSSDKVGGKGIDAVQQKGMRPDPLRRGAEIVVFLFTHDDMGLYPSQISNVSGFDGKGKGIPV